MGFKVILTPQSMGDLEEIVTFIAKNNPERAGTFGNELIDRALSIATFPENWPRCAGDWRACRARNYTRPLPDHLRNFPRRRSNLRAPLLARSERRADNKANYMTLGTW
jgi:plasmid stabilization system protein ParE